MSGKTLLHNSIDPMLLEKGMKTAHSLQLRYLCSVPALSPSVTLGKLRHSETAAGFGAVQGRQSLRLPRLSLQPGQRRSILWRNTQRAPGMLPSCSPNCCLTAKSPPALISPQGQTRGSSQFLQRSMAEPATVCSSDFY